MMLSKKTMNNDVVKKKKKTMYDKLVPKVNANDASEFVLKTKYDKDKSKLEKKISDADKKILILVDLLKNILACQNY